MSGSSRSRSRFRRAGRGPSGRAGREPRVLAVGALVSALALASVGAAGVARAAAPGTGVIAAIEGAPVVVIGEVRRVTPLAHVGYRATIAVERSLRSGAETPDLVAVAWEEPAPAIPPRLGEGRRVLVAVEALPTASIWRARLPDDALRASTHGLAGAGAGYLRRPGGAELDVLEHYLLVDAAARTGDAGALHLARLAALGQPRLAVDAAARLRHFDGLGDHLTPGASRAFVDALLRDDVPAVRETLLETIAAVRPEALRPVLESRLGAAGAAAPPVIHNALGALDGRLDDDRAIALLDSPDPDARAVAARHADGPRSRGRLRDALLGDPSPTVRAAAVTRLVELDGLAALGDATLAFADRDASVRGAAASAVAGLDPEAVAPLRRLAEVGDDDEARTALLALSMMGEQAHVALAELAETHPDPAIRLLAGIAVGRPLGDAH